MDFFSCKPPPEPEESEPVPEPEPAPAPAPLFTNLLPHSNIETPGTFSFDPKISSSWVYIKIMEHYSNQIFQAYNLHTQKSLRFPDLPEDLANSATAVLNRQLYVIGGSYFDGKPSKNVYMCDPVTFIWDQLRSVQTPRENAVAAAANDRIYVFGGCRIRPEAVVGWAEVYDPITLQWTAIQNPPPEISFSLSKRPLHAVLFRDRIFIRNDFNEIAYNVTSSSWEKIPLGISAFWLKWSSAVEVAGMLVAYHREEDGTVSIRAYDPGLGKKFWRPIEYLNPNALSPPAEMFPFLSVNGNLVAYHMGDWPNPLIFTMMEFPQVELQKKISPLQLTVHIGDSLAYLPQFSDMDLAGHAHAVNP